MKLRITEEHNKFYVEELMFKFVNQWELLRSFDSYEEAKHYIEWYRQTNNKEPQILWQGNNVRVIESGFKFIIQTKNQLLFRMFGKWEEFEHFVKEYNLPNDEVIKTTIEKAQNLEKYGTIKKVLWTSEK